MKKKIFIILFFFLASISLVYIGCKKKEVDNDQRSTADNSTAENAFNDVFKQVDNAAKETSAAGAKETMQLDSGGCATVTITPSDSISWPKTLTIDFGSTNCLCTDGRYRRGKLIANLTGKYRDLGTVITVTLDQYYVNDNHIEGSKTITNLGHVGTYGNGNNLKYSVVVANGKVTLAAGSNTIYWNSTRTREWIEGENTAWPLWTDDVYIIDGSASGTDLNGNTFTVTIINPLRVALNCKWIESGTIEVTPEGLATRTVDFGSGDCDDQANVTINGYTYLFHMH